MTVGVNVYEAGELHGINDAPASGLAGGLQESRKVVMPTL